MLLNVPARQLHAEKDTLRVLVSGQQEYVLTRPVGHVSTSQTYQATRHGVAYSVYFTQLPVIKISTRYQIIDTPSVYANFELVDTSGAVTRSAMGIEFRGSFSQTLPKKSYELSMWADTLGAASQNVTLLGMRTDNKWNLMAMYGDQLRLRNKVAQEMWQEMDQLYYQAKEPTAKNGIALVYAEVLLNGSYQGIYALTERMDRKQLQLKKYDNGIKGELYKGVTASDATLFTGVPPFDNNSLSWGGFEYKEPSEKTDWSNLQSFVSFVVNSSDADFYSQYQSKFKLSNAVDYFIFINLLRAGDNTGKNNYIAKYKAGEPYFYEPWDLDGTFGDNWYGANDTVTTDILSNGFYDRLRKDNAPAGFQAAVASRWAALRTSVVTKEHIMAKINLNINYLLANNVYEREQLAWPDYQYDAAQATYPADWLTSRIAYLDNAFGLTHGVLGVGSAQLAAQLQLYPNPANTYLAVEFGPAASQLRIADMSGRAVLQQALAGGHNNLNISNLPKGMYVVSITGASATVTKKLVIQ